MELRGRLATVLVLLVVACGEKQVGTAAITAVARLDPPLERSMLRVTFREGTRTWEVNGGEFRGDSLLVEPHSGWYSTGTKGTIDVAFAILDSGGTVQSAGEVRLPLRDDWRWCVDFINATDDPRHGAFGCEGSRAFALPAGIRNPYRDSLWVVWGGNWISRPVVY